MSDFIGLICLIAGTVLVTRGLSAMLYDLLKPAPPPTVKFKMSHDYLPTWLEDSLMKFAGTVSMAGVTAEEAAASFRLLAEQCPEDRANGEALAQSIADELNQVIKDE